MALTRSTFSSFLKTAISLDSDKDQEKYINKVFDNRPGAISYENRKDLIVDSCKFINCNSIQSDSTGGAISARTATHQSTECSIISTSFRNCSATTGGACFLTTGICHINQTCFLQCSAKRAGQAFALDYQEQTRPSSLILITIYHCPLNTNNADGGIHLHRNKHSVNSLNTSSNLNNRGAGVCIACNAVKSLSIRLSAFSNNTGQTGFQYEQHDITCETSLVKTHIINCTFGTAAFMSTSMGNVILNDCYIFYNSVPSGKDARLPNIYVSTRYDIFSDKNYTMFFGVYARKMSGPDPVFITTSRADPVPWNAATPDSCIDIVNPSSSKMMTTTLLLITVSIFVIAVTGIVCLIAFRKRKKSEISSWMGDNKVNQVLLN